jgi:hypothetical protein
MNDGLEECYVIFVLRTFERAMISKLPFILNMLGLPSLPPDLQASHLTPFG